MVEERTFSTFSRKKSVAQEQVTSVLRGDEVPVYDREFTADEEVLAALGYKPEFKREFSLWTSFCVSFAILGLLPSFAATMFYVCESHEREAKTGSDLHQGHGICGYAGHGMGLADSHVLHPMRRPEYGRAMLVDAHKWRPILCLCSSGSPVCSTSA